MNGLSLLVLAGFVPIQASNVTRGRDPLGPLQPGEIRLRTANYNIFGRWFGVTGYEGQATRLKAIPAAIAAHPKLGKDIDVITIDEAWCPDSQLVSGSIMCANDDDEHNDVASTILKEEMAKAGWPYQTVVVDKPGVSVASKQTAGGAMIFSKWPFLSTSSYVYDTCAGEDCHAAKGVVHVRIKKTVGSLSQVFNILGTHLQAWSTPEGAQARAGQLKEIHEKYLPAIRIPEDGTEVLLFQGDLNTDMVLYPEETDGVENTLLATFPEMIGSQLYSSDPSTNFLVGKDGAADKEGCLADYKHNLNVAQDDTGVVPASPTMSCTGIPTTAASGAPFRARFQDKDGHLNVGDCKAFCPCCPHEMLDYILYSTQSKYLQPLASSLEVIPLKSLTPLYYKWGWCDGAGCITDKKQGHDLTGNDLSDHYPMVSNFIFKATKAADYLDGCNVDSDCKFYVSLMASCYCSGPSCTWEGKPVNGWDVGASHPVNANCHLRTSSMGTCFCRPGDHVQADVVV